MASPRRRVEAVHSSRVSIRQKSHHSVRFSSHQIFGAPCELYCAQRKLRTKWGKTSNAVLVKGKGSPCSITERRVPELTPVLGSQPAGDVSHISDGRLPLLSGRPAVTLATLKKAATNFAAW